MTATVVLGRDFGNSVLHAVSDAINCPESWRVSRLMHTAVNLDVGNPVRAAVENAVYDAVQDEATV